MILPRLAKAYFSCFLINKDKFDPTEMIARSKDDLANSPELLRIKQYFKQIDPLLTDNNDLIKLMKEVSPEFNRALCIGSLFPSLILFFLRVFDIYDSAMQGLTVQELSEKLQKDSKQKPPPSSEKEAIQSVLGEKLLSKFGEADFWKTRYSKITSDTKAYDWYTCWETIGLRVIEKAELKTNSRPLRILELGCGNSTLATDIVLDERLNIEKVISIDFVQEVVDAQNELAEMKNIQNKLKFECVDLLDLPYSEGEFDLVIEKGCFDSVMATKSASENFEKACNNVSRVLKPGGYFVLVSCAINYDRLGPFKRVLDFKWKVTHLTEMPSDMDSNVKINLILIKRLRDEEVSEEIEKMGKLQQKS